MVSPITHRPKEQGALIHGGLGPDRSVLWKPSPTRILAEDGHTARERAKK
jgi:hypothetical protein